MKKSCLFLAMLFIFISLSTALQPRAAFAERCEKWAAKVVSVQGTVEARLAGETAWQPVRMDDTFCPGDVIRVQKQSRAGIALGNHPLVRLDENTSIVLGGMKDERTSVMDLVDGALHFFSRVTRNLEVHTAFVNAGVEGTEGLIRVEENKTSIIIFEGKVLASNQDGSLALTSGQAAVAEVGKAPVATAVVRPWDAVQWALHYPPVIYYLPAEFQGDPEIQKSVEAYWKGDLKGAFSGFAGVPEDTRDSRLLIYRASLLLTVGRVDEAKRDVNRALGLAPGSADALALQSIIAVAQNEKDKALDTARKAVEAAPNSATARVALSYSQQAHFDLDGALKSLQEAIALGPENALAWARLAEIQMSFGNLGDALNSAEKAVALNPDLARTQTVLGYAYLSQVKTGEARGAFEKAIGLDQADPLPRLGLGLAMIRESSLEEGRREIEVAVSLDPDNAVVRSYLGKAYFEEKREKLAEGQLDMAKGLDPMDPTAFFYDAVEKQTTNRPVEALHDMQKAIELNDNRAVYRSRLLLDEDLAARSASLSRIFGDLGFEQLALVEGWKSVNTAPDNYSAHRFLADSYSAMPRHEIARVSELLQSQLLQPINITPVQPHLAEGNLFVVSGGGPADLSFNEFNPMFLRDRAGVQVSGIVGENGTVGEEVTVSGLYKKGSLSVGQYHLETDGFRENNDLTDDIYNAFFQMELTHKTSIQAEYRYRNNERGDLSLRFFPDDFLPGERQKEKTNTYRLGFHHAFSPGSDLIGNFMHQNRDAGLVLKTDVPPSPPPFGLPFPTQDVFSIDGDIETTGGEIQQIFSSKYVKVTGGAGHSEIDWKDVAADELFDPSVSPPVSLGPPFVFTVDEDDSHTNAYLYSYINYPRNVTFTVGGSFDSFESEIVTRYEGLPDIKQNIDKDQFNPKFGVVWNPFASTTVRGAAFKTLKRVLIAEQTIEPTQVAGFNQFFDDINATESWRYGVAVDQKFPKDIYGGVELSRRDLEVPYFSYADPFAPVLGFADWQERLARAYLYWTPMKWMGLSAEYLYEKFERDEEATNGIKEVKTQRVPLGINFSHPSGLSSSLRGTFYDQSGDFERQDMPGIFYPGKDSFWLMDASISYRLPRRYGFITVGAKNLFDEEFQYFDTGVGNNIQNPSVQPDRMFFARLTLSL